MSVALENIKDKCIRGKRVELTEAVKSALADGVDAKDIMMLSLIPAMAIVGEKYSSGEFFLPQMMIAARAMSEAMEVLKSQLLKSNYERRGKVALGTVAGDFHDIGKNIVKIMLEGGGYEVVDLGVDTPAEKFIDAVQKEFGTGGADELADHPHDGKHAPDHSSTGGGRSAQVGNHRSGRSAGHTKICRRDRRRFLQSGRLRRRREMQHPASLTNLCHIQVPRRNWMVPLSLQ